MRGDRDIDEQRGLGADLDAALAPDLIAPVHAFRDWRVTSEGLASPRTGALWTNRVMRAQCRPQTIEDFTNPPHIAPGAGCTCGIHAYYELGDAASKIDWRGVSGIVTVWGRIEAHSAGLRAEYARVEALGTYQRWTRRQKQAVAAVAADLDVEVMDLYDLVAAAERFGTRIPSELIPGGPARAQRSAPGGGGRRIERRIVVAG